MPITNGHSDDTPTALTVLLKNGIHTIFIFASPEWTFSRLTSELLSILRERYPSGLTSTIAPRKITPIPAHNDDIKVIYGLLKDAEDPTRGWDEIVVEDPEVNTLGQKGFIEVTAAAFAIVDKEYNPQVDDAEFDVEIPRDDEDEY
ncbi:hypothetical protein QBC43DRAFT_325861 [Cladorrhinum sp. PSN259]|nr:hypothetical protein QBC43DRAFT_325861 [Cladorrhinum sp. PSN259]